MTSKVQTLNSSNWTFVCNFIS